MTRPTAGLLILTAGIATAAVPWIPWKGTPDRHLYPAPDSGRPLISTVPKFAPMLTLLEPNTTDARSAHAVVSARVLEQQCRLAVVDADAASVFWFDPAGLFLFATDDGPRDESTLFQAIDAVDDEQSIYVSALTWSSVAGFAPDGTRMWARRLKSPVAGVPFGGEI